MPSKLTIPALPRGPMWMGEEQRTMTVEWQNFFRDLFTRVGGSEAPTNLELGSQAGESKSVTIDDGEITVTEGAILSRFYTVDTEAAAATDDLDVVNGGEAGDRLTIQAASSDRTVVIKNNGVLKTRSDFSLNNVADKIALICISSGVWHQEARSSNAD